MDLFATKQSSNGSLPPVYYDYETTPPMRVVRHSPRASINSTWRTASG